VLYLLLCVILGEDILEMYERHKKTLNK